MYHCFFLHKMKTFFWLTKNLLGNTVLLLFFYFNNSSFLIENLDIPDFEPRLGTINESITHENPPILLENVKKYKPEASNLPHKDSTFLSIGENINNFSNNNNLSNSNINSNNNNVSFSHNNNVSLSHNNNLSNINSNNITNNKPLFSDEQKHMEDVVNTTSQDASHVHQHLNLLPSTNRHF